MKRWIAWFALMPLAPVWGDTFSFVAIGDTAYNSQRDYPVYDRLIEEINRAKPAFTIHVGDTWGAKPCTKDNHLWVRSWFDKFQHPLIYTPGDNEWTDCRQPEILAAYSRAVTGRASAEDWSLLNETRGLDGSMNSLGYADTLASLATIREVFFNQPRSQGATTLPLTRQVDVSDKYDVPENARWDMQGVVFATVNVPGSQNGFVLNDLRRSQEAVARNQANVAWLRETFRHATDKQAPAVVIALHAGMFLDTSGGDFSDKAVRGGPDGPYHWIALAIRDLADAFGKPVLLINGDYHEFLIDRPFMVSQGEVAFPKYANITRLQVYGAPELRAVTINVDPTTPWVFGFTPLFVE